LATTERSGYCATCYPVEDEQSPFIRAIAIFGRHRFLNHDLGRHGGHKPARRSYAIFKKPFGWAQAKTCLIDLIVISNHRALAACVVAFNYKWCLKLIERDIVSRPRTIEAEPKIYLPPAMRYRC
jgi:hypothetical protein